MAFNRIIKAGGLPKPVRQMEFHERGVYLGWVDFAFPEQRVAVETDSWRWHFGRLAWERDKRKANYLQRTGWRVLYFTWRQIKSEPGRVLQELREVLFPSLGI